MNNTQNTPSTYRCIKCDKTFHSWHNANAHYDADKGHYVVYNWEK